MLVTENPVRPWEKIGVEVPIEGRLRIAEALRLTKNDWEVKKVSLITAPDVSCEDSDLFGISNPQMR